MKRVKFVALILADRDSKGGFFSKAEEIQVLWKQILRIGEDVILVKESIDQRTLMFLNM